MRPEELSAASFAGYPPRARAMAQANVSLLRQLPLSFLGSLLGEMIAFDWRFPAEQADLLRQIHVLGSGSTDNRERVMAAFRTIPLAPELYALPWAADPVTFVEKLTAYLWATHNIDAFRSAALHYGELVAPPQSAKLPAGRWCIVVAGRGAEKAYPGLFRQLRARGTRFTNVDPEGGWSTLQHLVQTRAAAADEPYSHWYVDGGKADMPAHTGSLTTVSYAALSPVRQDLLHRMHNARTSGTVGPESLRSLMAQLRPADLPWAPGEQDEVLRHFQLSLLTEGSGTQVFSTTFVQWAAREILRRAKPATLLLRYAPRQADRPMNDLLLSSTAPPAEDPEGSLVDASMGAYYTWINAQRLPGAEETRFLAWRESGHEAVAIAPGMAQGSTSPQRCTVEQMVQWMS